MAAFLPMVFAALLLALAQAQVQAQAPAPTSAPPPPSVATGDSAFTRNKFAVALKAYETALTAQPQNLSVHVKAGYSALALDLLTDARQHFQSVLSAAPPSGAPLARAGMAMVMSRSGSMPAALGQLDTAVTAGYGNVEALDHEKGFDKIRKDPQFVRARNRAEAIAYPCLADSASRVFDFWVGDWDVYVAGTGQLAGYNRIERIARGCALLENWTATSNVIVGPPSDGKSMNFVDPATGLWKQVWMGSGKGQNNYEKGRYADGVMRFEFSRRTAQGNAITGRFAFFNLGPNRVRQFQESSRDGGATWQTVYDFIYVRRGSGEKP